jgi:hypothetical protein
MVALAPKRPKAIDISSTRSERDPLALDHLHDFS